MNECEFCGTGITRSFTKHLKNCHSQKFKTGDELLLYSIKRRYDLTDCDIENIMLDYKTISTLAISQKYNIPYKTITSILSSLNIRLRSISESVLMDDVIAKRKSTNLKRHGVENPSQSNIIKEKKKATFLKHYGVDNIFKDAAFIKSLNEKMMEKYGTKRLTGQGSLGRISNIELDVQVILNKMDITYIHQFPLNHYLYDFLLPNNLILEVNGDYWHCNPKYYGEHDIVRFPGKELLVKDVWQRDLKRKNVAADHGYRVFYL